MNSLPFGQLKSFLKILIGVQYETSKKLKPPSVNWKISTGAVEKCALCSRMRQASAASTIPSTAGAKKASDHAFHVTIFGNTGMPMVRSSRWLGNPVFLSCPIAILRAWICFCGNYPNNFRRIPFWCAAMELHGTNREHWKCLIVLFHIPPYTPEMNPIEQIWKEIRKRGFRNEVFAPLEKVVDRLCDAICSLTPNTIFSITGRDWIVKAFN